MHLCECAAILSVHSEMSFLYAFSLLFMFDVCVSLSLWCACTQRCLCVCILWNNEKGNVFPFSALFCCCFCCYVSVDGQKSASIKCFNCRFFSILWQEFNFYLLPLFNIIFRVRSQRKKIQTRKSKRTHTHPSTKYIAAKCKKKSLKRQQNGFLVNKP